MKFLKLSICLIFIGIPSFAQNTAKPWAYWWWPGSAVNEADLKISLQKYAEAGFGGLHIIPIYGVKGEEEKFKCPSFRKIVLSLRKPQHRAYTRIFNSNAM